MAALEHLLIENRVFPPPAPFSASALVPDRAAFDALCREADADPEGYWARWAQELLNWQTPFTQVLDAEKAPFYRWFADGKLNVSYNCLDRHLADKGDKTAIIFEDDEGDCRNVSYRELHAQVCKLANGLKQLGVVKGDRVVLYMPMSVEAVVAMQACARIGAIHSVVFGGFSAKSLHERIVDADAKLVITANEVWRGGKHIGLKDTVDEALATGDTNVQKVIVYRRSERLTLQWSERLDIWWDELVRDLPAECEPEWVEAEHPLFILYTSGSTGTPKGIQHSSGGYLLGALYSLRLVMDLKDDDVFWCTADVGWITGHSYVAYGPLAAGATQVIFEGAPAYPDPGRAWRVIAHHRVSIFYTAPTAIRTLIKLDSEAPKRYDLSCLRLLGSVGEPINPEAWMWYYEVVGGGRCPIVDTWWQTETGAHMIAPIPGAIPTKPGSCTLALPGISADVVDEHGQRTFTNEGGYLVIRKPWPFMVRTIWNNPERYVKSYFPAEFRGAYMAGDSARRDPDGYFWIMGRVDDVLNVSGHRLGTMEIESALVAHPMVAEAAVVGRPHEIKGECIVAFVVLKRPRPEGKDSELISEQLRYWITQEISIIARPDEIRFGDNLPKTRSGKIMRRLLRALAKGEQITQDVSTLENPAILDQLK